MESKRGRCSDDEEATENLEIIIPLPEQIDENPSPRVYQCKDCDKTYDSFQALGGHRASHKKVKANVDGDDDENSSPKMHACKVCGEEFPVGQALGGHMRRHQGMMKQETKSTVEADKHLIRTDNEVGENELQKKKNDDDETAVEVVKETDEMAESTRVCATPKEQFRCRDLNLPPDEDEDEDDTHHNEIQPIQVRPPYFKFL